VSTAATRFPIFRTILRSRTTLRCSRAWVARGILSRWERLTDDIAQQLLPADDLMPLSAE
jgi:hypothetical protein